jgi:hypothetical protein
MPNRNQVQDEIHHNIMSGAYPIADEMKNSRIFMDIGIKLELLLIPEHCILLNLRFLRTYELPLKHLCHINVCHLFHTPSCILMDSWFVYNFHIKQVQCHLAVHLESAVTYLEPYLFKLVSALRFQSNIYCTTGDIAFPSKGTIFPHYVHSARLLA